jgi:hypothetical protein
MTGIVSRIFASAASRLTDFENLSIRQACLLARCPPLAEDFESQGRYSMEKRRCVGYRLVLKRAGRSIQFTQAIAA